MAGYASNRPQQKGVRVRRQLGHGDSWPTQAYLQQMCSEAETQSEAPREYEVLNSRVDLGTNLKLARLAERGAVKL